MAFRHQRQLAIASGATALLALAACTGGGGSSTGNSIAQPSGKPVAGDTLTIAVSTPPISLDPAANGNGVPLDFFNSLGYEPLIERHGGDTTSPGLATSWAYSNGNKTFTLHIRPSVKFADGEPLTADSVVKFVDYYKVKGQFAFNLAAVESVKATGPLEVTFNLKTPDPLFEYYLDQEGAVGLIAAPKAVADPKLMQTGTYGAGAYTLDTAATVANSSYVYNKNPNFWDTSKQHYNKIVVKVIADKNATLAAIRSGQVQVAQGDASTAAAASSAGLVVTSHSGGVTGVVLTDRAGQINPPLAKVEVRQALNLALDRKGITSTVYKKFGKPTSQYVAEGSIGYTAANEQTYAFNVAKAKSLLSQAGYPNGFSFDVLIQPGVPGGDLLAQAMQQQWAAIGVKVNLVPSSNFAEYVGKALTKKYAATTFIYNYQPLIWEANELFSPTGIYNFMGVVNPEVDALRAKVNAEQLRSPESKALSEQLMTLVVNQALSVPVSSADIQMYSTKNIGGVNYSGAFPIPNPIDWYQVG
jgi:peptide/nickel transport system substrate-binding protein